MDRPWLKYYKDIDKNVGVEISTQSTVWDVIEGTLEKYKDVPAIEYFGRVISRAEFKKIVYSWAIILKNMGIEKDEIVPIYGCLTPDIAAITFGLNIIGAVPYFLKLAISPEALEEETAEARVAVVFEGMWENVSCEFLKEKYEKVIIYRVADSMRQPQKALISIASAGKNNKDIFKNKNVYTIKQIKKQFSHKREDYKAEFEPNKRAFITSSSGTTVGGIVKGTVATNEATIAQLYMVSASGTLCEKGDRALNNFPPTAATSLNLLLFLPLFRGATVIIDPRISVKDFYNQIIKYKPNFILTTGSLWETFFVEIEKDIASGKKFDFSYMKGWMIGGEGSNPDKYKIWNNILKSQCAPNMMISGYGCSELFSSVACDTLLAMTNKDNNLPVMGVGIPFYGLNVGIFDSNGKELPYNTRGELWISSKSVMKGYYNKPELTSEILIDGWIHTGDLAQINEDGYVFIWGRVKDSVKCHNGETIYNFDIANKVKESKLIREAIVLPVEEQNGVKHLTIHLEWACELSDEDKKAELKHVNEVLSSYLHDSIKIYGYAEYDILPYSPTTLKKDKNLMSKKRDGFIKF